MRAQSTILALLAVWLDVTVALTHSTATPDPFRTPGPSMAHTTRGLHLPLKRGNPAHAHLRKRDSNAVASWAKKERSRLLGRYGPSDEEQEDDDQLLPLKKRQQAVNGGWYSGYHSASASASSSTSSSLSFRPETTGGVGKAELTNYLADLCVLPSTAVGSSISQLCPLQ